MRKLLTLYFFQTVCKISYDNLCTRFTQHVKSSAFESRCSKVKIPSQVRREERLSFTKLKLGILIDSDAKLFKYLIECTAHEKSVGTWLNLKFTRKTDPISFNDRDGLKLSKGSSGGATPFTLNPCLSRTYFQEDLMCDIKFTQ